MPNNVIDIYGCGHVFNDRHINFLPKEFEYKIFDLDKKTTMVKHNAGNPALDIAPKGSIQSVTSFGFKGYGGACPPQGDSAHRYVFTVHALNVKALGIDENSTPAMVGFYLNKNTLAKASLIAYYGR